jgi:uridine kinase
MPDKHLPAVGHRQELGPVVDAVHSCVTSSVSPFVIGVAGGTGSGKTTLARALVEALPPGTATLLAHDCYYRDRSHLTPAERAHLNFDEPLALDSDLLVQHIAILRTNQAIDCPEYDFVSHTRLPLCRRIDPSPIIVIEGILLFAVPHLRDALDLRVFVDTDDDVRLLRRIRRDLNERGRDLASVEAQYLNSVRPMHRLHVEPARAHADLIIPHGGHNQAALAVLTAYLQQLLSARDPVNTTCKPV